MARTAPAPSKSKPNPAPTTSTATLYEFVRNDVFQRETISLNFGSGIQKERLRLHHRRSGVHSRPLQHRQAKDVLLLVGRVAPRNHARFKLLLPDDCSQPRQTARATSTTSAPGQHQPSNARLFPRLSMASRPRRLAWWRAGSSPAIKCRLKTPQSLVR